MSYSLLRIIFFLVIFSLIGLCIAKKKIRKIFVISIVTIGIVLFSFSFLYPIENKFIKFETAEDVFKYIHTGDILDITYGNDSCMVYYRNSNNSYSYCFVEKNLDSYKIISRIKINKIYKSFSSKGNFEIYNIRGTNDYYFLGLVNSEVEQIELIDSKGEIIDMDLKWVEESNFAYSFFENYSTDYYILLDNEKITLN